jgi:hypothetical protein
MVSFIQIARNVMPAVSSASRMLHQLLPAARHLYVETCEGHSAGDEESLGCVAMANERRFFLLDLMLGRPVDPHGSFSTQVIEAGGEDLLTIEPGWIDTLGLDYYAHSEWHFVRSSGVTPSPRPAGLAVLAGEYWSRYQIPMILGETNIRGYGPDRASWLKFTLEQCEQVQRAGLPLDAYCWFPFVDSIDWDSLLARADRHIDPVGVYWLDARLERHASSMAASYRQAVAGAPSAQLPAYRFSSPVNQRLIGFLPLMSHWDWQDPPAEETSCDNGNPVVAEAVAS